jgi:DNA-binding NtrC family response regulator
VRLTRSSDHAVFAIGALPDMVAELNQPRLNLESPVCIDPTKPYAEQRDRVLHWFQSNYFSRLLRLTNGNKSQAARIAEVERSYLGKVVKTFGEPQVAGRQELDYERP